MSKTAGDLFIIFLSNLYINKSINNSEHLNISVISEVKCHITHNVATYLTNNDRMTEIPLKYNEISFNILFV